MDFTSLVHHPFSFAAGVGVANGLLAIGRGKKIDPKTAFTLAIILGLGETALVMYEPQEHRGPYMSKMTLLTVGIHSMLGVMAGVLPFVTWGPIQHGEAAHSLPIAQTPTMALQPMAGWR